MADGASLKMLGDWRKEIGVPLRDALYVSMNVMGRTGEEACKHALILMAQSARSITKQAPKNRKIMRDPTLPRPAGDYVEVHNRGRRASKLYRLQYVRDDKDEQLGTWDDARKIGARGLAKRSWTWGMGKIGGKSESRPIRGTSRVYSITKPTVGGYVKENRLDYIHKAMPSGWERTVELRAGNKIMAQARQRMERQFKSAIRRRERAAQRNLQSFFKAMV